MISHNSKCVRNLKIGDEVLVKLLPCCNEFKTFKDPIWFPVIGVSRFNIPLIGTNDGDMYENHHFIRSKNFYVRSEIRRWTYCMRLNSEGIQIEKIRRRVSKIVSPPLQR